MPGEAVAVEQLRSFVERIERLREDANAITADIRAVLSEAKGAGFDSKALREIVRLRAKDSAQRAEEESILDLYKKAIGL